MLNTLVHVKPSLHCYNMCGSFSQLGRLGNLWLVAQFENILQMLISCSNFFYSLYLSLNRNLSSGIWISLQNFLRFRVRMICLFVLMNLASFVDSSLLLQGKKSLMLNRYYNYSLTMLCNYSKFLPVYSMIEIFISQLSCGRVYGRYLVPQLSYLQLTIHRPMVRLRDKIELQSRLHIVLYMRVVQTGCMLFLWQFQL